jgi:predicted nucleic acid-binding protein
MRVLLDTNILLDVLLDRSPFADHAAKIWSAIQDKKIDGWISAISINNLYYISKD